MTLPACRSVPPQPPLDFSEPDWTLRQGQAVWKPSPKAPEIAGDLLVAMHPDGRSLVQFTKPPLPLVVARQDPHSWQVQYFAQNKIHRGRRPPPERIIWLHLPGNLISSQPDSDWALSRDRSGAWQLSHALTGESLEGFLTTQRMPKTHRVQEGEHILRIARRYGVTLEALRRVNPGPEFTWLRVSNLIHLPPLTTNAAPAPAPQP
jgi:hypothetical protein